MLSYKELLKQAHDINKKNVYGGDVRYYKARTDTVASCNIEDTQYHFFDGTTGLREWINDFRAVRIGLFGAAIGYDEVAELLFCQMMSNINLDKKQVFTGFSRGGALGMLVLIRVMRYAETQGKKLDCELVSFNMPKAGGRKLYKVCKKLGFKHTRIYMVGDFVHNIVWWWKKPYSTKVIALENNEKGIKKKHQNILPYL